MCKYVLEALSVYIIIIIIIIKIGVTAAGSTQKYYIAGGQEKRKDRKTWKSRVKRRAWVLAQPPDFPQGNGRQLSRLEPWNQGVDHLTRRRTQGAGIFKGREDKRDRGRIPDTFT